MFDFDSKYLIYLLIGMSAAMFAEGGYLLLYNKASYRKNINRRLKVMDQVIRHMVVRVDEEKKVVDRTRTKRQSESERRRVKRGLPPQRQPGEGRAAMDGDDDGDDRFDGVEV